MRHLRQQLSPIVLTKSDYSRKSGDLGVAPSTDSNCKVKLSSTDPLVQIMGYLENDTLA